MYLFACLSVYVDLSISLLACLLGFVCLLACFDAEYFWFCFLFVLGFIYSFSIVNNNFKLYLFLYLTMLKERRNLPRFLKTSASS